MRSSPRRPGSTARDLDPVGDHEGGIAIRLEDDFPGTSLVVITAHLRLIR